MNKQNYCIIMAGGIGSRFWPLSKANKPKQFLDILGIGRTFIQQTYDRFAGFIPKENFLVVTNEAYKELVLEQLPLQAHQILTEPCRRNTAPCIAYAAFKVYKENPKANLVVAPSDHLILDEAKFVNTMLKALAFTTANDALLTLGMKPTRPETGYGYIQAKSKDSIEDGGIYKVNKFTEKPKLEMAKVLYESGEYFWNAGIFVWSVASILKAFEVHLPEVYKIFNQGLSIYNTVEEQEFINRVYPDCQNISIDFGIMESAERVYVLCTEFGWSDLGTWGSLYENSPKTSDGSNVILGSKVILSQSSDNIINMAEDKLVVIEGLSGYIVVNTPEALLICKKEDEQQLRHLVTEVKNQFGENLV